MLGIPPLQKRSLLLFFQQYGQVLSDVFLNTRRLFSCSGRNERMPNRITQREPQRRGAFVQSLFMSLAWTSSCVGHFPSICFYAGIPIWENCFFFFWRNLMITNSPCCVFPLRHSSPIALSPHHPSLHPPFTSSPRCLCWALLIRYLFPVVSQDKNMKNDPEKEQNKLIYVVFHWKLVG